MITRLWRYVNLIFLQMSIDEMCINESILIIILVSFSLKDTVYLLIFTAICFCVLHMSHDTTKHVFRSFRPGQTQSGLRSHRSGCPGWSAPMLFAYDIRHIFSWPGSHTMINFLCILLRGNRLSSSKSRSVAQQDEAKVTVQTLVHAYQSLARETAINTEFSELFSLKRI